MNETPETLRAEAKYYRSRDDFGDEAIANRMDAHAAAWEADLLVLDNAECHLDAAAEHIATVEADRDALREAYALLWTFDLEPKFDARGTYSERKSNEWKTLLDKAQGICPRPLASLPPEESET